MAGCTIHDLPPELLYTILSHRIGNILFDYLFLAPLIPNDTNDHEDHRERDDLIFNGNAHLNPFGNGNGLGGGSPNTAVVNSWTARRINRNRDTQDRAGGIDSIDVPATFIGRRNQDGPLNEISSLAGVSVAWRIIVLRILRAILHHDYRPHHLQAHAVQSPTEHDHLTISSRSTNMTTTPLLLGQNLLLLKSMQVTLRTLMQESIDTYRTEQDSMLVPGHQTGIHTPTPTGSNTPSQMTIPIPNTTVHAIPSLLLSERSDSTTFSSLFSSLTEDDCPFAQLPIFTEALRYTQASIFTIDDSSSCTPFSPIRATRNDLSLTLTSSRIAGAMDMLRANESGTVSKNGCTRQLIRPKEIAETVNAGMESVTVRLQQALQVCEWNDILERVFLRGERSDEMLTEVHACFESMEERAGTIEMFHLLRSGLYKTVQLVSRVGVISQGYGAGSGGPGIVTGEAGRLETSSEEWKVRAGVLSFCWTGRVIGWTGL